MTELGIHGGIVIRKAHGAGCYTAAHNDMVDDVIDPRETRPTVIRAFEMGGRVERPWNGTASCRCRAAVVSLSA